MQKPTPGRAVTAAVLVAVTWAGMLAATAARAAPAAPLHVRAARLSIASPVTGNLVAGLVPVTVAFDAGAAGRVTLLELWVDDLLYSSEPVDLADARGTLSIDWDTQRLRNGQHSLKVRVFSGRKLIAADSALVTVSNGGADVVPPLVSFYAPLDGQTVSGNVDIGINASDNDQVALVGLFVNRHLRLMKSDPPFKYTLDTTTLPLLNGRGTLKLEAWAYDRAQNRGVAKPITVYVNNPINATPLEPDPKGEKRTVGKGTKGHGGEAAKSTAAPAAAPRPAPAPRLAPLAALESPTVPLPPAPVKSSPAATPPAAKSAKGQSERGTGRPAGPGAATPSRRLPAVNPTVPQVAARAPEPSAGSNGKASAAAPPGRTVVAVKPRPAAARLEIALSAPGAALAPKAKPVVAPSRGAARAQPVPPHLKPAPVLLPASRIARLPDDALIAVPRPSAPRPASTSAARPVPMVEVPVPALPKPHLPAVRPAPARRAPAPAAKRLARPAPRASAPDRIVLPVYRLARLPDNPATSHEYTVRRGDRLSDIAREHGVTPRSILVANGLLVASEIRPGRRLSIPGTFAMAYNDQPIGFDVPPRVEKGMAIAPFRQIFEHTGGVVRYHPADREVLALSPEKQISLKIGSREALVNSAVVLMDRAAFLDSGRTMVPVKFMTQALDLKAEYDLRTGAIYLIHQ